MVHLWHKKHSSTDHKSKPGSKLYEKYLEKDVWKKLMLNFNIQKLKEIDTINCQCLKINQLLTLSVCL